VQETDISERGLFYAHYKQSFAFDQDDRLLSPCHQRSQSSCLMLPPFGAPHQHIVEDNMGSAIDDSIVLSFPCVFHK
jgi:hypothetical protein